MHRSTPHSTYENYGDKDGLRVALVTDQRGLCCYCMGPISPDRKKMKIEHWQCVERYPEQQLAYRNMLGSCKGGEGKDRKLQHCDTRKADRDLLWNPADPYRDVELRIKYSVDGTIGSTDEDFDKQINEDLNLNIRTIKDRRKSVVEGIVDAWQGMKGRKRPVSQRRLRRKINELTDACPMDPYSPVAIWWLRELLAKMA